MEEALLAAGDRLANDAAAFVEGHRIAQEASEAAHEPRVRTYVLEQGRRVYTPLLYLLLSVAPGSELQPVYSRSRATSSRKTPSSVLRSAPSAAGGSSGLLNGIKAGSRRATACVADLPRTFTVATQRPAPSRCAAATAECCARRRACPPRSARRCRGNGRSEPASRAVPPELMAVDDQGLLQREVLEKELELCRVPAAPDVSALAHVREGVRQRPVLERERAPVVIAGTAYARSDRGRGRSASRPGPDHPRPLARTA